MYADDVHPHLSQIGANPVSLLTPPEEGDVEGPGPLFDNIDDFTGTEKEFLAIKEYGSSWRTKDDGTKLRYGVYNESDFPEDKGDTEEWDD